MSTFQAWTKQQSPDLYTMNLTSFALLCFFSTLLYVYCVDPNVEVFIGLWVRKLTLDCKVTIYKLMWNPTFPWVRFGIKLAASRNAEANAKKLRKELGLLDE